MFIIFTSNGKIIRTAAQMAEAFNGTLTALFVETPLAGKMGKEDQERLKGNISWQNNLVQK